MTHLEHRIPSRNSGEIDGVPVETFELTGGATRIKIMTLGAILQEVHRPDRSGVSADIALGYDDPVDYLRNRGNAGAVCGRHANRIAGASFMLNGKRYDLGANDGRHHLHGGATGFGKRVWTAQAFPERNAVRMEIVSEDGDEGYPARLTAAVTYTLTDSGALEILMEAEAEAATIVNLVHHGYWNLAGHGSGSVENQMLSVDAHRYTPTDAERIPTGRLADVVGTPFDFRDPKPIGRDMAEIRPAGGYDHNLCVDGYDGQPRHCVRAWDPASGRALDISSDQPGLQLYTANHLSAWPTDGKAGARYGAQAGFALETQNYPNAPNESSFPSSVIEPGQPYRHSMLVTFSTV